MSSSSASASPTTGLHEALLPPAYPISDGDRGGYVMLPAVIMVVITGLTICVKLQISWSTFHKFRSDDFALMTALITAVGYTIAICGAVDNGLGRVARLSTSGEIAAMSQHYYASNIILFLSLAASKTSIALLIIAIQPNKKMAMALYGLIGLIVVWGIAGVFVVALQCSPTRWVLGPTETDDCIDMYTAMLGLKAVDIVTDVILAISPALMMLRVQISTQKRLVVALMFGFRLATPVFTAMSLVSLSDYYDEPTSSRPFAAATPAIYTSVLINVSLITACLPSIKRFLSDWAAGVTNAPMEAFEQATSSNTPAYGSSSGLRSFVRSQTRGKLTSRHDRSQELSHMQSRDGREHRARGGDTESTRGLQDGIIMQTVDYRVDYAEDQPQWDGSSGSHGKL